MASFAREASEIIEAVAGPLMRSYWGPILGLFGAGGLYLILREFVKNNERDSSLISRGDDFAAIRRKEEAEYLARTKDKSEGEE